MAESICIEKLCKRIYAGGDVPKDRFSEVKTEEFTVPIYANAEKDEGLYGYTDEARECEPSVTVAARGTIGYTAIRTEPFVPVVRLITVVPKQELVDLRYMYYALKSCKPKSSGTSIPQLTVPDIKKYSFEVPSKGEQIFIVGILDSVQKIIDKRRKEIEELDNLIKSRFVEMFGDPKNNPKKWDKAPLCSVSEVRGRVGWKGYQKQDLTKSGPLVLGATHLSNDGSLDLSEPVHLSREKFEESPEIVLRVNDLIFTQRGNTIGRVGLIDKEIGEATINPCVLILRPIKINPVFFMVYFLLDSTKKDMWKLNSGSAQPMITQKGISNYSMMLPTLKIQKHFADFVKQVGKMKIEVKKSLIETQQLMDSLMQKHFG